MKENALRKVLVKCSKEELIKTIIKASELTYATFPWIKIIFEIWLNEVETKIDVNLAEGKELTRKLNKIAESLQGYTYDEILKIRIALDKNHKEWERLNRNYDKIYKELYG